MSDTADFIDSSLAEGTSVFPVADGWALRRRDGVFVHVGGAVAADLEQVASIGDHPVLGPAFSGQGFLRDQAGPTRGEVPMRIRVGGRGVLHDVVGGFLTAATRTTDGPEYPVTLMDAPPAAVHGHARGVVIWPEGTQVFVSPRVDAEDAHPVTAVDVLSRRITASRSPGLLAAYFSGRRRAPVTVDPAAGLLVAALALRHLAGGPAARRRLVVVDLDTGTWADHHILPVPRPPARRS